MKKLLLNCILIIINIIGILNIIVLPFKIEQKRKENTDDENEYFIYTNLEIGEPPQKINCELNIDISDFFITYNPLNVQPTYNNSLSKSFIKTSNNKISSSGFDDGYWALENFYCYTDLNYQNKIKIESLSIVFPSEENKLSACEIGLKTSQSYGKYQNFFYSLKTKQIINNVIWTLNFKNLNEGILAIGSAPHEYDKTYKESELKYTNTFSDDDKLYWNLYYDYDPVNNNYTMSQNIKVKMSPKTLGIIAMYNYLNAIEEIFFQKYYDNNICEKTIISLENKYYFKIICYKEVFTEEDIKQFPPLYLYNMFFNYLFVLDGKELFIVDNYDKYEFQILIEIGSTKTEWKLGRIFLSKYQIIFDDDNGLIGFYTPSSKIEVIDNNKNNNFFIKILIISLSVLLLLFIIFLINKKLKFFNKRKTFANELEDNFMYVPGRNNKN